MTAQKWHMTTIKWYITSYNEDFGLIRLDFMRYLSFLEPFVQVEKVLYSLSTCFEVLKMSTGNKIRLVSVPTTRVSEVNHPNAIVPPKLLKQKITNPAINTNEV